MATASSRLGLFGAGIRTKCRSLVVSTRSHQGWIKEARGWKQRHYSNTWDAWPTKNRAFSTTHNDDSSPANNSNGDSHYKDGKNTIRLSRLLAQHTQRLAVSRREAERLIKGGDVTVAGQVIKSPHFLLDWDDLMASPSLIKVEGKGVELIRPNDNKNIDGVGGDGRTLWLVNKRKGEVVADFDPQGRPSMMDRLMRGGIGRKGKKRSHIKSVGRLDMMTEGLVLVTTCGKYARDMELPSHQLHRTYRVRVHGLLTRYKVQAIQRGLRIEDKKTGNTTRYGPMKVHMEAPKKRGGKSNTSTNTWIKVSCTEGKNRQIRNVFQHLGLTVTRLIRISFGDYHLDKIPPGNALEIPIIEVNKHKRKGSLFPKKKRLSATARTAQEASRGEAATPVQWVRHYR